MAGASDICYIDQLGSLRYGPQSLTAPTSSIKILGQVLIPVPVSRHLSIVQGDQWTIARFYDLFFFSFFSLLEFLGFHVHVDVALQMCAVGINLQTLQGELNTKKGYRQVKGNPF